MTRRAASWRLRTRRLAFGRRPLLMGVVNVTPDSFSDGGCYLDPGRAAEHALDLVRDGADLIDVGGESTRPYAEPIPVEEELRRVLPVLDRLRDRLDVPLSIDTRKAAVAEAALELGAEIINDVSGLEGDPRMAETARRHHAGVCVMHMQGDPRTMQNNPVYDDVVEDVYAYFARRRQALLDAGLDAERLCFDPGIGFGKRLAHNVQLLARCARFHDLGHPLLVGPSRKRFIGELLGNLEAERESGTIAACLALARQGVQVLRVHDVAAVRRALTVFEALAGLDR